MEQTEIKKAKSIKKSVNKRPTFEESMARLSEVVDLLESGNVPLDGSLELYEEGIALIRSCETMLDEAEKRVKILTGGENGEVSEEEFSPLPEQ